MSTKVDVYFNLHKKCLSVRDCGTRRVIQHTDSIMLKHVEFVVSETGRQRVLRERRKNVHAFVRGYIDTTAYAGDVDVVCNTQVTYNPYNNSSFMKLADQSPIKSADHVIINGRVILASGNKLYHHHLDDCWYQRELPID